MPNRHRCRLRECSVNTWQRSELALLKYTFAASLFRGQCCQPEAPKFADYVGDTTGFGIEWGMENTMKTAMFGVVGFCVPGHGGEFHS